MINFHFLKKVKEILPGKNKLNVNKNIFREIDLN